MTLTNLDIENYDTLPPETQKALEEYRKSVCILSRAGFHLEFNNKDPHHASIVMSAIFNTAKDFISIFCGNFSGQVSNNPMYLSTLTAAIAKGVKIDVVMEEKAPESSKCMDLLTNTSTTNNNVTVSVLHASYRKRLRSKGIEYLRHFTVADNRMFRYETDPQNFKAICNFDDTQTVEILSGNFAFLKTNADPLAH